MCSLGMCSVESKELCVSGVVGSGLMSSFISRLQGSL